MKVGVECGRWCSTLSKAEYAKKKEAFLATLKAAKARKSGPPPVSKSEELLSKLQQGANLPIELRIRQLGEYQSHVITKKENQPVDPMIEYTDLSQI